ncbi:MAG: thymidine phosphorylase family protein [Deltaproteobacteria bacterium]|nr:thymidine phosphorylase family protein [Deltaproteobacteria bacterium]
MFRLRRIGIDTQAEHVVFLHRNAVEKGRLGLKPLDRVRVISASEEGAPEREIQGILNFCYDELVAEDEIGLSESAFRDLDVLEGTLLQAALAAPPESVARVRDKLGGSRLERSDFDAILSDVVHHRYSKVELSMFVLACALQRLDVEELIDFTKAMIDRGTQLSFPGRPVVDKHCIGGIPGNRTTMILVPILAACGLTIPKTSSRAITSPAGTADSMGVLADVALGRERMYEVVERTGGCIAWGGALDLAPADDVLITVERPMGIDTEAQMVASIISKKKAAGATHTLIDIPLGDTAKVTSRQRAHQLGATFEAVARAVGLEVEIAVTEANGPVGIGVGPRLEALDVLAVLDGSPEAPIDLREKSLFLASRILETVGAVAPSQGYVRAREALDSGAAARKLHEIIEAQGPKAPLSPAPFRAEVAAVDAGRVALVDCRGINSLAKLAGAPAHPAAGLRVLRRPGDGVERGEPLCEIHAQSQAHLSFALDYANQHPDIWRFGS